jgi:hypothetical protein
VVDACSFSTTGSPRDSPAARKSLGSAQPAGSAARWSDSQSVSTYCIIGFFTYLSYRTDTSFSFPVDIYRAERQTRTASSQTELLWTERSGKSLRGMWLKPSALPGGPLLFRNNCAKLVCSAEGNQSISAEGNQAISREPPWRRHVRLAALGACFFAELWHGQKKENLKKTYIFRLLEA